MATMVFCKREMADNGVLEERNGNIMVFCKRKIAIMVFW